MEAANNLDLVAQIVSAYMANNSTPLSELPKLIADVNTSINGLSQPVPEKQEPKTPAVPWKKSIHPDYLISLEDGKHYKSLKRHLRTKYGLSPEQYREKWDLPADYPMVAPNYAKKRSELAKETGLGQRAGRRR